MAPAPPPPSQHSHRPTGKHQKPNKAFKSKHASKSSLRDAAKGRTHKPSNPLKSNGHHQKMTNAMVSAANNKANRKNKAKQMQERKRIELEDVGRLFSKKGGERVSRIVAVVPLTSDVDPSALVEEMLGAVGVQIGGEESVRTADVVKFHNQSLRFILLPPASDPNSLFPILDACSAADFVLLGVSSKVEVEEQGETCLRSMTGTGVGSSGGTVMGVVRNLPTSNPSTAAATRASLQSFLTHFFPSIDRITLSSSISEASNAIRSLCEKVPKGVRWRETRGRLLAEGPVIWIRNADEEHTVLGEKKSEEVGTLKVEGVVRGARLSANRLVHITGWGDFMLDRITSAPSTSSQNRTSKLSTTEVMAVDQPVTVTDLSLPDPEDADDLASTNVPDDEDLLMGEQTWPTEEEIAEAPSSLTSDRRTAETLPPARPGTTPKRLKRVPKGTSTYQAAWIIDEDSGEDEDEDGDFSGEEEAEIGEENVMKDNGSEDAQSDSERMAESSVFGDTVSVSERPFDDLSPEQEAEQLKQYLADRAHQRTLASKDDLDFPDEVDTPLDIPARERFARYRGLKSFRTSPWDPYEELPRDYARCFMFQDFKGMGRRMEKKATKEGVEPGTRVILHIKNVPQGFIESYCPNLPLLIFGLLKHEHKYSVTQFTIQRNTEYNESVRSKDSLVISLGPRRFVINPIFSQHTVRNGGKGTNNVHKFERFLRHGINATIATAYLPITFGSQPATLFRVSSNSSNASIHLVGSGTLLSSDPTRIIAKRVILTGHPFKIHKKTATIRYMFFNQPDIEYYKPVALRTKKGRTGHIRESLGTHGYFKAGFDGPLDQMDTVEMRLYKRCYPKWTTRVWRNGDLLDTPEKAEMQERLMEIENDDDVEMP